MLRVIFFVFFVGSATPITGSGNSYAYQKSCIGRRILRILRQHAPAKIKLLGAFRLLDVGATHHSIALWPELLTYGGGIIVNDA